MNTVLVVECKQYKKPNKKNFTEAIEDYAGGRPVAQIILANYTSIPESFRSNLSYEVSARVPFFDALIPGDISCEIFKKAVKESLPELKVVSLFWDELPRDMDLMLLIHEATGKTTEINYRNRGSIISFPFAYLENDDTHGNGHETINALTFRTLKYEYYVNNFSGEETIGEFVVDVMNKNTGIWVSNDANLEKTELWHAVTIANSKVSIVDKVVPYTWDEDEQ